MIVDPSKILESLKIDKRQEAEVDAIVKRIKREKPEAIATNEEGIRDHIRGLENHKERSGPYKDLILDLEKQWNWFDLGEFSRTYNIMPFEDLLKASEAEWIPYKFTVSTVHVNKEKYSTGGGEAKIKEDLKIAFFYIDSDCLESMDIKYFSREFIGSGDTRGIIAFTICNHPTRNNHWLLLREAIKFYKKDGKWCCVGAELGGITSQEMDTGAIALQARCLLSFIKILKCKNVYINKEDFPKKLQKKRADNGHIKGFDKHTLMISGEGKEVGLGDSEGSHASPRLHFRRGHIRRLSKGDIWVRECMVGSPHGVVEKSYKVG